MSFVHTKSFKYLKNLLIGLGASVVMIGALGKLNNYSWGGLAITAGLATEAFLFFFLGVIGPDKDYFWEKLYPGLDNVGSNIAPITAGDLGKPTVGSRSLDANVVENNLSSMLEELQAMSKSLGSLKALQEVDFSETGDQLKSMHNFYTRMNDAMATLNETVEDTKMYKEHMTALNKNLTSLNAVYGNVLSAYRG